MKKSINICAAACAAILAYSATANAGYVVMEDTAFPSVLYFEFDGDLADDAEPEVISAPRTTVITAPAAPATTTAPAPTSTAPVSSNSNNQPQTLEQQAENRVRELERMSEQDLNDLVIDAEIDRQILQRDALR